MIYHINPEKRTVCCRMPSRNKETGYELWEEARDQATAKLRRYMRGRSGGSAGFWVITDLVTTIFKKHMGGAEYFGVAYCHPNDEFNEEKGKIVARNKALMSYYKDMERCMAEVADLLYALHEIAADKAEDYYQYEERIAIRQENY
jgi:hypothetical protein